MFLEKAIRRIFKKLFFLSVTAADIEYIVDTHKIEECKKKVELGSQSFFYKEAVVINLTKDRSKIVVGQGSHIRGELLIYNYARKLSIGNNSYLGHNSIVRAAEEISIGNNVLIAHNVTIIDSDSHEIDSEERAESFRKLVNFGHPNDKGNVKTSPIKICDYAWISYNCAILKGVTIGRGAIVAAGSVVTKDVKEWTLVAGNPARYIRDIK